MTFDKNVSQGNIDVSSNDISVLGKVAFSGIKNVPSSQCASKIEGNTMRLSRGTVIFDSQASAFKNSTVTAKNNVVR